MDSAQQEELFNTLKSRYDSQNRDDRNMLAELLETYSNDMLNYAKRKGARSEADDVVQEAKCKILKYFNPEKIVTINQFKGYVLRVTSTVVLDHYRHVSRHPMLSLNNLKREISHNELEYIAFDPVDSHSQEGIAEIDYRDWRNLVSASLDDGQKRLLEDIELGRPYQEIADREDLPMGTVKWRINNFRQRVLGGFTHPSEEGCYKRAR